MYALAGFLTSTGNVRAFTGAGNTMKNLRKLLIIVFWLLLWEALALLIHNSILMVGPVETLCSLWAMIHTTMFWQSLAFSFVRIIAGFLIGSALGILLAWGSYRHPFLEELLAPFILALKAVPVASFVIILLIWAGNRMLSLYISALVVLPLLYLNTLNGLKATDPKLLEMATVFHMPTTRRLRFIYLPALFPYLYSAFQTALGMAWKSGVAAEVIGQPLGSMGNGLYNAKIYLETGELLSWTIAIILTSYLFEQLFLAGFRALFHQK